MRKILNYIEGTIETVFVGALFVVGGALLGALVIAFAPLIAPFFIED